jgi:hypothetical protein
VEDRHDFDGPIRVGVAQFDKQRPFTELFLDDFSLVGIDIFLDVGADVIGVKRADVDGGCGVVGEVDSSGDGDDLKYFELVRSDFDLEFHVFAQSDRIYVVFVDVHRLDHDRVGCAVLSAYNDDNWGFDEVVRELGNAVCDSV